MSDAAYGQALARLFGARRLGVDLGLGRMRAVIHTLEAHGVEPRHSVQIAGTNGKGSTGAFLEALGREAGLRTGVFSSPHLLTVRERFRIDGVAVGRGDLVRAMDALAVVEEDELTFFEQVTAMAYWLFRDKGVDLAIYEVGLGGRLDSTTAIPVQLSAVTTIGLDHCEYLGSRLEEIAAEKAGTFRAGARAVLGPGIDEALHPIFEEVAKEQGAELALAGQAHLDRVPDRRRLVGEHQRDNAATALAIADLLGLQLEGEREFAALSEARLAGRFEAIREGLVLDGAHNEHAMRAVAPLLAERGRWCVVLGVSAGKDAEGMIDALAPFAGHWIASRAQSERAMQAGELAELIDGLGHGPVTRADTLERALELAAASKLPTLVTGSLYVVGECRGLLTGDEADPVDLSDPLGRSSKGPTFAEG